MNRLSFAVIGIVFVLAGAGCSGLTTGRTDATAAFGSAVTFGVGQLVEYEDGLNVTLLGISDSRCPADVQCFWEGELSGSFGVSGGAMTGAQEVRLGAATNPSASVGGYSFVLVDATELNMTVLVSKE